MLDRDPDSELWRIVDLDEPQRTAAVDDFCAAHPEKAGSLRDALAAAAGAGADLEADPRPIDERLARLQTLSGHLSERYADAAPFAHGGMGDLLRVRDTQIRRTVAMKVLRRGLAGDEQERFLEEGQIQGQLDHRGAGMAGRSEVAAEATSSAVRRAIGSECARCCS